MAERPILFSGAMVRALLAGAKTQTRRVMKLQPSDDTTVTVERFHPTVVDRHGDEQPGAEIFGAWWHDGESGMRCPYGAPGDRLWVREAWRTVKEADDTPPRDMDAAYRLWYEADAHADHHAHQLGYGRYRPPMFMPRWASRITLEITGVRVERLQDISAEDCSAEGIKAYPHPRGRMTRFGIDTWQQCHMPADPREAYFRLLAEIHGDEGPKQSDWLWVVEFKRMES